MKRAALFALVLIALAGLGASGGGFFYVKAKAHAPGLNEQPVRILIEPGLGVSAIAARLQSVGVTHQPLVFRIWARLTEAHTKLRAGEYELPVRASAVEVLDILQSGKTVVRKLTLAEGLSLTEALLVIQDAEGLEGDISTIPDEGWLLPETYHYSWGDTRNDLIARMADDMGKVLGELWDQRAENFILTSPKAVLILASIVEKETAVAAERPLIAAVFLNRLKKGMRLQSDPTVVYALTDGGGALGRALTRADLKIDSPYNTYRVAGLPPTPIANPGRDAIRAVIHPAETEALYFVADGSGGHVFANTLKEHNRNVQRWRKIKRDRSD
ncbi:endolytic transglycosylase MltG [Magnetovibrio sp.]|uniref:endolytic transglycosylase MltG n=1 Tax=Magnetovibrio sp. TaxID=2024836 RepID=UPI002F9219CD